MPKSTNDLVQQALRAPASRVAPLSASPALTPIAEGESALPSQHTTTSAEDLVTGTPTGIVVRLAEEVDAAWRDLLAPLVPAGARVLWERLLDKPIALQAIEHGRLPRSAENANPHTTDFIVGDAFVLLDRLWGSQALVLASAPTDSALEIRAGAPDEPFNLGIGALIGRPWRMSRFASLRGEPGTGGEPVITIEHAAGTALARVSPEHAARMATFFASLLVPREVTIGCVNTAGGGDAELLFLLAVAGIASPVDVNGMLAEDRDPTCRQWEHHDLLMHFRSRQGRHSHEMGASFRFNGTLDAQPALKPNPWRSHSIALPRPDLRFVAASDPPFTTVLEMRRSTRAHDSMQPIDLVRIGHFLYRSARVRSCYRNEIGEFTSRPYPSGGASHELEIYLTIDHARDVARGFYYYDPVEHTLCLVRGPDTDMEALLHDAWISSARMCRPQVLITLASRFQRVSWKYSGMAYAAQLKNVGVLYQTFYLVATAMNLAGCALGLGNAQRFARMAGTDFLHESSVGEFMLGTPAS